MDDGGCGVLACGVALTVLGVTDGGADGGFL